jgi:hypothetical protein
MALMARQQAPIRVARMAGSYRTTRVPMLVARMAGSYGTGAGHRRSPHCGRGRSTSFSIVRHAGF